MKTTQLPLLQAPLVSLICIFASIAPGVGAQDFQSGTYLPINDLVLTGSGGAQVIANGNVAFSFAGMTADGDVDENDNLTGVAATIPLRAALTLELRAEAGGDFEGTVTLPLFPLPGFQVPPHVYVTPFVYMEVYIVGSADADVRGSVVLPFSAEVGISIPGHPVIGFNETPEFHPRVGGPDVLGAGALNVYAGVRVGVCFLMAIDGVPIGGPVLETTIGAKLDVDPSADPWWDADGLVLVTATWGFGNADGILEEFPIPALKLLRKRFDIAQAPGPLDIGTTSTRWSRIYDLQNNEDATALFPVNEGFVTFGNGSGVSNRPWTSEIDGNGVPTWENHAVAQPFGSMRPKAACVTTTGEYIVAGYTLTSGGMRVERYSSIGVPLWARTMAGGPSTLVTWKAILPSENDGAILGGNITYVLTGVSRPIFAEIDSAGTLVWVTEVDPGSGSANGDVLSMVLTADGGILAAGSVDYANDPDFATATLMGKNALLMRLNIDGTVIFAKAIGCRGWDYANTIAIAQDGTYVLGGGVPNVGVDAEEHAAWIAQFDVNNNMMWSATYAGDSETGHETIRGASALEVGGFLVTGSTSHGTGQDAWVFQIDEAGMPVWFKSMRGDEFDQLSGIVTLDNGLIAYGYTKSLNDELPIVETDLWILRTNVDGMLHFLPNDGFVAVNDSAKWASTSFTTLLDLAPANVATTLTASVSPFAVAASAATVEVMTQ